MGKPLGKGRFGTVYLSREKETQRLVAIKVLNKNQLLEAKVSHQLKQEVEIHARLSCNQYIVPLYATFQDKKRVYLVMRYAKGGNLYQTLREQKFRIEEKTAIKYMKQLMQ